MSKYSLNVNGKVEDYGFKKLQNSHYAFYIGGKLIGQVFNLGKYSGWSAVWRKPHPLNGTDGFKTRLKACQFLLKMEGLI